jgi:hypothetical protein
MYNTPESESRDKGSVFEFKEENTEFPELNILRRAYELILENSDLFFSELANAFTLQSERRESNLLI